MELIDIIIILLVVYIIFKFLNFSEYVSKFYPEYFVNIENNKYPNPEIMNTNNILNNLYRKDNITNDIANVVDNNINDYYKNEIDFQRIGQYGLLRNDNNIDYSKYYDLYKHQLNCPSTNMEDNTYQNDLDVFKVGNTALSNNKKKSCVSCNFDNKIGAVLTPEQQKTDKEMIRKNKLVNNNLGKFADYSDFVNQNSNQFETQVDKLAQCRTAETCELNQFGDTIWQAYDNLLSTDFTKYQTSTNPDILTGTNDIVVNNLSYEKIPSIDYSIDKLL